VRSGPDSALNAIYADRLAVDYLQAGIGKLDPGRDPELAAITEYLLIHTVVDCGNFREASERLLASGLREAFAEDPLNLAKLRWLEGRIAAGLGKLPRAERALLQVREQFLVREDPSQTGFIAGPEGQWSLPRDDACGKAAPKATASASWARGGRPTSWVGPQSHDPGTELLGQHAFGDLFHGQHTYPNCGYL